jgi:hypothetical protein
MGSEQLSAQGEWPVLQRDKNSGKQNRRHTGVAFERNAMDAQQDIRIWHENSYLLDERPLGFFWEASASINRWC